ncbi:hypothetical protein [Pseudomonas sp. KNUC1026]|uniref:hypothetical protein n=1 Tax=Pseudomonas sp. KNUC1026 TaxID=2893890 RepID=UPI001F44B0F1|nr:hypothetical protein [Pseudomonas sp. KNUC1026]UFH51547.1 hypothetical protein LN139_11615 [Pseudomonas sp. KNUC1026]
MLHIMDAELIEGNYVLYQGDLSTKGLKQHLARWASAFPGDDGPLRKSPAARHYDQQNARIIAKIDRQPKGP